jgi:hypothetical protein
LKLFTADIRQDEQDQQGLQFRVKGESQKITTDNTETTEYTEIDTGLKSKNKKHQQHSTPRHQEHRFKG